MLSGELQWRHAAGVELDDFTREVAATIGQHPAGAAPSSSSLPTGVPATARASSQRMANLGILVQWHQQGLLTDEEFQAAKRKMGLC